ncbi:sensor histidine kinase [Roseomonas nepalensis]|uniref:histidine kinase n=1 Tax=Muricoccus nepalensis TaxID=1854500 RepID=A0A502G601_9PROT|nr:HAMP domain-containing sensor histidine kinase [Roseomonas nepalensis]TPG57224.1 sensor histidine kinase [Roseomonas nepalensis]
MRSLKARLVTLWTLSLLSSLVLGLLLVSLHRQSTAAQVGRTEAVLARACDMIRDRFGFYATNWHGPASGVPDDALRRDLVAVLNVALARQEGVEGGVWAAGAGSLAYAFPTYEGSGPKTDLPSAEAAPIAAINAAVRREERTVSQSVVTRSQSLLLAACPLDGPVPGLTAWTMGRVRAAEGLQPLQLGLPALLALLVLTTGLLGRTLFVWGRHLRGIEAALGGMKAVDLPVITRSGERELDRVVDALNLAGTRLAEARREADALAGRVARAERMAALGRVAAGVAHEIRNPIAAARLQGENALAGDDGRRRQGIADMLAQLGRLDDLVSELLAMTQRVQPRPTAQDPAAFLHALAARHAAVAARSGLSLDVAAEGGPACFDPAVVARILDNLVGNALRHATPDGTVALSAVRDGGVLSFGVADSGDGIPPGIADRLFEPFVTGRADGTGLGLAIARELADAHGGRLRLRNRGGPCAMTQFVLELPQDSPCPPASPSS